MRRALLLAAAIGLSGCVSDQLNQGLTGLVGRPIDFAVQRLGYPNAQREILGDTLYIWSTNRAGVMPILTNQTTTGLVGNVPVTGTTSGLAYVPVQYDCTIEIAVTAEKIIKSWRWEGNLGGCQPYAQALSR